MPRTSHGVCSDRVRRRVMQGAGGGLAAAIACQAAAATVVASGHLADLSLEQLREVVVTTVSRFEERLDRTAAAVYVISADDIRRAGATTLPEALRLAPTLNVARADANQYAISARGFNNVLANKMLVLIDGRTVYTPLFSGVFWEAQDVLLEDVERIEVITGPSTALWGSNAVNGLIHVITRFAAATQGPLVALHAGDEQRGAAGRYGTALTANAHVRVYAKAYDRDATRRADGSSVNDRASGAQAGWRADWARALETFTLQGDAYRGAIDQILGARRFSGANVLARWERRIDDRFDVSVQGYVERTERDHPQVFEETLDTADLVAQAGLQPFTGHRLLVGAGLRHARDRTGHGSALTFIPANRRLNWQRLFVQDQMAINPRLTVTLAGSFERNPYTGTEVLPSARLAWQTRGGAVWWAAASRAVRAPSRIDREFFQPANPPFILAGGPQFESEVANVFDLGHRAQPDPSFSYSVNVFHHEHQRLRSIAPTPQGLQLRNDIEGHTQGLEAWVRWRASERWRLDAGGVLLRQKLAVREGAVDLGGRAALGNDPRHWWSVRSGFDITPRHAWDVFVRRVGALANPQVPSYTAVDTRFAWSVTPSLDVALLVQNLFDAEHAEWGAAPNRAELERSFRLHLRWRP